jgi:hypothetical protein
LSGSGKSTISKEVAQVLQAKARNVELLDGDVIRTNLSKGLGFSKEDRDINVRRIGFVAHLLTRNGVIVLVSAISPYREVREQVEQETTRQAITRFRTQADSYARQFGFSGYQIREVQVGLQEPPVMLARAPMMRAASVPEAQESLPVEAGKTSVNSTVSGSVQMVR